MKMKSTKIIVALALLVQSITSINVSHAVIGVVKAAEGDMALGLPLIATSGLGFTFGAVGFVHNFMPFGFAMVGFGVLMLDENGIPTSFKTISEDTISSLGIANSHKTQMMVSDYNDDLWMLNGILETSLEFKRRGEFSEDEVASEINDMMQKLRPGTRDLLKIIAGKSVF